MTLRDKATGLTEDEVAALGEVARSLQEGAPLRFWKVTRATGAAIELTHETTGSRVLLLPFERYPGW